MSAEPAPAADQVLLRSAKLSDMTPSPPLGERAVPLGGIRCHPIGQDSIRPGEPPERHYRQDYESACRAFHGDEATAHFDGARTGKVNMAPEAIDRHLPRGRRLIISDAIDFGGDS